MDSLLTLRQEHTDGILAFGHGTVAWPKASHDV
jgi:hypothetical protein